MLVIRLGLPVALLRVYIHICTIQLPPIVGISRMDTVFWAWIMAFMAYQCQSPSAASMSIGFCRKHPSLMAPEISKLLASRRKNMLEGDEGCGRSRCSLTRRKIRNSAVTQYSTSLLAQRDAQVGRQKRL